MIQTENKLVASGDFGKSPKSDGAKDSIKLFNGSFEKITIAEDQCILEPKSFRWSINIEDKDKVPHIFSGKNDAKEISCNFGAKNENKSENDQNNEKIIQKFNFNENAFTNNNIDINNYIQSKEISNNIENSPPSKTNSKGDSLFPQNNHVKKKSSNMSFALNPPTTSKCKRQSSFSIRLSQAVDHEKEKRKSQMQKQLLSEKSFDEMMVFLENSQAKKCQNNKEAKNEKKIEENNNGSEDVFFSILQQDSDSLHNLLQDSDENDKPIDFFPTLSKKPRNPENYELTDYSSNSSSADGSYDYEWREMAISDEKDMNNENSLNFTNNPNFNDPCSNNFQYPFVHQPSENDLFFSQKTNVFGIFKNNQQEQVHDYNTKGFFGVSQQPIGFSTINFQKNPMDNQKRVSHLMSSPQKKEMKFEKKLVCTRNHVKKIIPDWASDMNAVKNKLLEQRNADSDAIFGSFVVDNLDLRTLFNEEDLGNCEKRFFFYFYFFSKILSISNFFQNVSNFMN